MKSFYPILLSALISHALYSQADSLAINNPPTNKFYFSGGMGLCNKGLVLGYHFTWLSKSNWGARIGWKTNMAKSKDTPDDYYDDDNRSFAPKDYLSYWSASLVKEFPIPNKSMRLGIEAGPSLTKYNIAVLELNTSYDPEASMFSFNNTYYLYNKSHTATRTAGFTFKVEAIFPYARNSSLELAAFTNINNLQSIAGIELILNFGKMRAKSKKK